MKKIIRNTAIAGLAVTVAAVGAVCLPPKAVREIARPGVADSKVLVADSKALVENADKSNITGADDAVSITSIIDNIDNKKFNLDKISNCFTVHDCKGTSFMDLNCDKEVVYEVHVVSAINDSEGNKLLNKLANDSILEVSNLLNKMENQGCGFVIIPDYVASGFDIEEKFGVTMELSNTEDPGIMPLGYTDLSSENELTVTPLSKVPGRKQFISWLAPYLSGKKNVVFDNKTDAESLADYLTTEYNLVVETTPFSRLSYEGKTYNWVPSSSFQAEYEKMDEKIRQGKAEFGICWKEGYAELKEQISSSQSQTQTPANYQTEFFVRLDSYDAAKKIQVIKAVKEILGCGLGEAKVLVEGAPRVIKEGVSRNDAKEMIKKIEEAGGHASADGDLDADYYSSYDSNYTSPGLTIPSQAPEVYEEQTEFYVILDSFDASKKIPVIKVIKEITGLSLGEAKSFVEGVPKVVKENVSKAEAKEIIKKIEEAGGHAWSPGLTGVSFTDQSQMTLTLLSYEFEDDIPADWEQCKVTLESYDSSKKIPVIKAIREITGLGLGEAKAFVEGAPKLVKDELSRNEAMDIAQKLKDAGGKVSVDGIPRESESKLNDNEGYNLSDRRRTVAIISSYDSEKEKELVRSVAEALGIEEEQAENIVKYHQNVKTVIGDADNQEAIKSIMDEIVSVDENAEYEITKIDEKVSYSSPRNDSQGFSAELQVDEQTSFVVTLESFDASKKIPVIKAIREITGLGLGEAKALVEGAPKVVKENVSKAEADDIINKIQEAGGIATRK